MDTGFPSSFVGLFYMGTTMSLFGTSLCAALHGKTLKKSIGLMACQEKGFEQINFLGATLERIEARVEHVWSTWDGLK